jgi:hypothetical protein
MKIRLPNGLDAEVLRINQKNGDAEGWPWTIRCYGNSHVVKVYVGGETIGLVLCGNCLYQNAGKIGTEKHVFLPEGAKAVGSLMKKHFGDVVKVASPLVYNRRSYERGTRQFEALKKAIRTGVPPAICMLVDAPENSEDHRGEIL